MMRLLGNVKRGKAFIVSAPAGTGKTTLVEMLMREFPTVKESVSLTTRAPRKNEVDGEHYHFVTEAEFEQRVKAGDFLEHAKVFSHQYGTSRKLVEEQMAAGYHVVLVIDTQGALQLMGEFPAIFTFISPPSLEELRARLEQRKTESPQVVNERLAWAVREMAAAQHYDYHIINEDLGTAYQVLRSILVAEEHRVQEK